jgi:NifU-like protein involved in Fe-S cluster formation
MSAEPSSPPSGTGQAESDCGDRIKLSLWVERDAITRATFEIHGCTNTLAAARAISALAAGQPLTEALQIERDAVLAAAAPLPPGTEHVADLALEALREAVLDALRTARDPWKRLYR